MPRCGPSGARHPIPMQPAVLEESGAVERPGPVGVRRAWQLSGLVARRCHDGARQQATWRWPVVRQAIIRLAVALELAGGLGVADADGRAVACLAPPRMSDRPRLVMVVVGVVIVGAGAAVVLMVWWPLFVVMAAAWALIVVPAGVVAWRCRAGERRLGEHRPPGGWGVRNFAADARHRGAGRALLTSVCADADRQGRVLYLDTTAARLVDYYRGFGFEVVASEEMRSGRTAWTVFRMVRPAQAPPPA